MKKLLPRKIHLFSAGLSFEPLQPNIFKVMGLYAVVIVEKWLAMMCLNSPKRGI